MKKSLFANICTFCIFLKYRLNIFPKMPLKRNFKNDFFLIISTVWTFGIFGQNSENDFILCGLTSGTREKYF
jgi:hypothetical protein